KTAQDALTNSGEKFTTQQKDAAKALDLAATKQEAIAKLQQTYAGAAKAYGDTSAGASDKFKVAINNLEITLGNVLLPTLTKVTKKITDWLNHVNDSGDAAKYAKGTVNALSGIVHDLTPIVQAAADAFKALSDHVGGSANAVKILGAAMVTWKLE